MQTQIQYFTKDIKNLKICNTLNHHSYNESIEILKQNPEITNNYYLKSIRIWIFLGSHFPTFGLNMEKYSVSLRIHSEYGKTRTRKTPSTDTFHRVNTALTRTTNFLYITYLQPLKNSKRTSVENKSMMKQEFENLQSSCEILCRH